MSSGYGVQDVAQRGAFHILHHQVEAVAVLTAVVNMDDVRVVERRQRLGLAAEAVGESSSPRKRTRHFGHPADRSPESPGRYSCPHFVQTLVSGCSGSAFIVRALLLVPMGASPGGGKGKGGEAISGGCRSS